MGLFGKNEDISKPKAEEIPVATVKISHSGNITFANKEAKRLLGKDNIENTNLTDYFVKNLPELLEGNTTSVLKAFKTVHHPEKYIKLFSKECPERTYTVVMTDVSEDYDIMKKLVDYKNNTDNSGKNKNLFISQISNVLKAPIHSVMGYSQAIIEGMGGETDERQRKYLEIIYKNSNELFQIIDKLIELSKTEAQVTEFSYKSYDITNILNAIYSEYSRRAGEKRLSILINTDNLVQKVIYGDEQMLKILIGYLLENAILSCNFGNISVTVSDKEFIEQGQNKLKIRVSDSSSPIGADKMAAAFNPYYQPDKKNRTGLIKSMIICTIGNLVSQMRGHITAEPEASAFNVTIPTDKSIEPALKLS